MALARVAAREELAVAVDTAFSVTVKAEGKSCGCVQRALATANKPRCRAAEHNTKRFMPVLIGKASL